MARRAEARTPVVDKAYTALVLGTPRNEDTSGAIAQRMGTTPSSGGLAKLPHILLLQGAIRIKVGNEAIGAIGVGGAPGAAPKRVSTRSVIGLSIRDMVWPADGLWCPKLASSELLARMLEQHGAITIRCPMVAITDVPDAAPVVAWLCRFTTNHPDGLILMTGEGLERLVGFARRAGLGEPFLTALAEVRKITRGP